MKRSNLIKGTLILTAAGLVTRLVGFLYRIYLADALGAELLGIYQLIFPVYSICHTIYASGIQTSVSKLTAEEIALGNNASARKVLLRGVTLSVLLAVFLSAMVYLFSVPISVHFLKEAACAPSLRILALVFPFCGITACINGYCYGKNRASLPAVTQIAEQLVRVLCVVLLSVLLGNGNPGVTCELAVFGVVAGEIAANIISILALLLPSKKIRSHSAGLIPERHIFSRLFGLSFPLTLNRLLLSILHSYEAIMIPFLLRRFGLSSSDSLREYGILNGMALPFIYFATAITNALAVLLLPSISEDDAKNNRVRIGTTVSYSISCTLLLGIFCNVLFLFFGDALGTIVFHENSAGVYIRILSCLCPFLYLTTTLGSILNGLGKTAATFVSSMSGSLLRIALLYLLVPRFGMTGCFLSLLFGQLVLCTIELLLVYHHTGFHFNAYRVILKPGITAVLAGFVCYRVYRMLTNGQDTGSVPLLLACCAGFTIVYIGVLIITGELSTLRSLSGQTASGNSSN